MQTIMATIYLLRLIKKAGPKTCFAKRAVLYSTDKFVEKIATFSKL